MIQGNSGTWVAWGTKREAGKIHCSLFWSMRGIKTFRLKDTSYFTQSILDFSEGGLYTNVLLEEL